MDFTKSNSEWTDHYVDEIVNEKFRADKLHPNWPENNSVGLGIILEQVGKYAKLLNDARKPEGSLEESKDDLEQLRISIGAMALRDLVENSLHDERGNSINF